MSAQIGFAVILMLYASVGVFAVIGSAVLTQRFLPTRWEQAFYAGFLIVIAGFYAAFIAYFEASQAWPVEAAGMAVFCVLAVFGLRWLPTLMLGYVLHGAWDLAHELQAHNFAALFGDRPITAIPLAYGVFCASFDVGVAIYAWMRRSAWTAARLS